MKTRLKGINENDQNDILAEIRSHIYESYNSESDGDDIDRILKALKRLGKPAERFATGNVEPETPQRKAISL